MLSKPFGLCGYFPVNLLGCFAGIKVGATPLDQDKSFPLKTRQLLLRELLEGGAVAVVHLGNQHLHSRRTLSGCGVTVRTALSVYCSAAKVTKLSPFFSNLGSQ